MRSIRSFEIFACSVPSLDSGFIGDERNEEDLVFKCKQEFSRDIATKGCVGARVFDKQTAAFVFDERTLLRHSYTRAMRVVFRRTSAPGSSSWSSDVHSRGRPSAAVLTHTGAEEKLVERRVYARKYAIGIPPAVEAQGLSYARAVSSPRVLNDSAGFIYSGNENPNRLSLRCYIFLPEERPRVRSVFTHTYASVHRSLSSIEYRDRGVL